MEHPNGCVIMDEVLLDPFNVVSSWIFTYNTSVHKLVVAFGCMPCGRKLRFLKTQSSLIIFEEIVLDTVRHWRISSRVEEATLKVCFPSKSCGSDSKREVVVICHFVVKCER